MPDDALIPYKNLAGFIDYDELLKNIDYQRSSYMYGWKELLKNTTILKDSNDIIIKNYLISF